MRKRALVVIFAAWTAYGLGYVLLLELAQPSRDAALPGLIRVLVAKWYWAALTPAIFLAADRLAAHTAIALAAVTGGAAVNWGMRGALGLENPGYFYLLVFHLPYDLAAYLLLVAIALALRSHRYSMAQIRHLLTLERELAGARLRFLQRQLQPHFLFNALNATAELTREAPASAARMLGALRRLLATALRRDSQSQVSLREELAGLEPFLEIQRTRFSDQLSVVCRVEEAALGAQVPTLVLQPLVENAIRHGLAGENGSGIVQVVAAIRGERLRIEVIDNGRPFTGAAPRRGGIGLSNTAERLRHLYGSEASLDLNVERGIGTVARLDLPLRGNAASSPASDPERPVVPESLAAPLRLPRPGPVLWIAAGVFWVVQTWMMQLVSTGRIERWGSGLVGLGTSVAWALLAPLVLQLSAGLPLSGPNRLVRLGAHLTVGLAVAAALTISVRSVVAPSQSLVGSGATNLFTLNALIYCALVVWAHADLLAAAYRERTLAAERLQSELMRSRLQNESLRIRPGWVLDTLARAEALAAVQPEQAERLIERLADALRGTLDASINGVRKNHSGAVMAVGAER